MSNPNKIHYPRSHSSIAGVQFNPKLVVGCILVLFSLYAVYKYGQFSAEKKFDMAMDEPRGSPRVELLAWQPRVFYHHSFLTDSEVSSLVGGSANVSSGAIKPFSGNGAWFEELQKRIARFTQEPISNFEQGFFSKYDVGTEADARRDWFKDDEHDLKGAKGNRVATLIMFLSSSGGGEISFPKANIKVTPKQGDALLIWNLTPDHKIDELAVYGFQKITKSPVLTYTIYVREKAG